MEPFTNSGGNENFHLSPQSSHVEVLPHFNAGKRYHDISKNGGTSQIGYAAEDGALLSRGDAAVVDELRSALL